MIEHDPLAEAEAIGTRLIDATREARAAIRDLRGAITEARDARIQLTTLAKEAIDSGIAEHVRVGLEGYNGTIQAAMDAAVARVDSQFAKLSAILMGEDRQSKAKGEPSLTELVEHVARKRNAS